MLNSKLELIINNPTSPLCLRMAHIVGKGEKAIYVNVKYLQTDKHRLAIYSKPICKVY